MMVAVLPGQAPLLCLCLSSAPPVSPHPVFTCHFGVSFGFLYTVAEKETSLLTSPKSVVPAQRCERSSFFVTNQALGTGLLEINILPKWSSGCCGVVWSWLCVCPFVFCALVLCPPWALLWQGGWAVLGSAGTAVSVCLSLHSPQLL